MSSFQISLEKFWQGRLNFKRKLTRTICSITLRCVITVSARCWLAAVFLENIIRSAPCDFNFRVTTLWARCSIILVFEQIEVDAGYIAPNTTHQTSEPPASLEFQPNLFSCLCLFACARGMLYENLKMKSEYAHDRRSSRRSSYCALLREGKYSYANLGSSASIRHNCCKLLQAYIKKNVPHFQQNPVALPECVNLFHFYLSLSLSLSLTR